jgi:hypothetical protein
MSTVQTSKPKRPPLVRFTPWAMTLLVLATIALLVIAAASVATAINTREVCKEQGATDYLGASSCSM